MQHLISPEEFSATVKEFASYKSSIQGCSTKTVEEYLLDLRTFFRFLLAKEQGIDPESDEFLHIDVRSVDLAYLGKITTDQIYEFLYYTGNVRKNLWCAKARKLSSIKGLYKFLVSKRGYLKENPAVNIDSPKPKKTLPKVLSLDESVRLLVAVLDDDKSKTRERDFAILTLFLNCGMRVSELVGINLTDLESNLDSVRVIGKGSKERVIYLNAASQSALRNYLEIRTSEPMKNLPTKALFVSGQSQRISVKTVQYIVYKYLKAAGLEGRHYSVHKLRHTAATLMYQSGKVDIRVLKDILGHEQLNTTQIYTHVSDVNMRNAMNENPLAAAIAPERHPKEEALVDDDGKADGTD